ncbi:MAG: HAD family hydrolase [Acidimicrobiales bacterium]
MDELRGEPTRPGVAAFDFDGTLVGGDSLAPFLIRLLGRPRFGQILARSGPPMLAAYRVGGRDASKAALLVRAVAGLESRQVAAVGEAYGAGLARRVRPDMAARLAWHGDQGHRRVLISASLSAYLEPFGRQAGFDEVIATRLEVDETGRLTGRILGANVRGAEKAARLVSLLGPVPVELWAYGDSAGDRELLAMADHPHRVGLRRAGRLTSAPSPS